MGITSKHVFTSGKANTADLTEVQGARDWDDGHVFLNGNHGSLLVRDTTDATYGGSWVASVASGQVLVSAGVAALPAWSANLSVTTVTATGAIESSTYFKLTGGYIFTASADGKATLQNTTSLAGVGFDVTTDGTLKLRNRAHSADAAMTASAVTAPLFSSASNLALNAAAANSGLMQQAGVTYFAWDGSQFYPAADNARTLGIAGTNRWSFGHFGTALVNAGYYEGTEMTAPSAGAVNTGRMYFDDNGGGKTRLMVIFNTGAAQQIAIQP